MLSSLIFGLLVAGVHGQLKDRIQANAIKKVNDKLAEIFTEADVFDEATAQNAAGKEIAYRIGKDQAGKIEGYAIQVIGGGFADKIGLLVAVDVKSQNLLGVAVLSSNETPGFGDKIKNESFKGQFANCPAELKLKVIKTGDPTIPDREIVAISGATISSDAVVAIVNKAILTLREINKQKPGAQAMGCR